MQDLLAITVELVRLLALIRLSSTFTNVMSPEAPTQVARRPCWGPIRGIGAGVAYLKSKIK